MRAFLSAALLSLLPAPALAGWSEARTRHFIIYSEQKPEQLRSYAERLEQFDAAVRKARGMADPLLTNGSKLTIYMLPNKRAVEALSFDNVAGFYIGRAGGSIAFVSPERLGTGSDSVDPEQIFFHEYTHHLMLGFGKTALPSWMIEGFAEFYSTALIQPDGSVMLGSPPQEHATVLLRDLGFSARHLLSGREPEERFDRASVYAKGWLLTHYLTFDQARSGQLALYLGAINRGIPAETAAVQAFGDLRKLDSDLDRYATSRTFLAVRIAAAPKAEVTIRPLTAGESAIMRTRIRSDRGPRREYVGEVAAQARKVAAAYPADAFVQGTLAEAEFDAGNHAAAILAADRALAVSPDDVQALVYKGRALMALARTAPDKADWITIRRLFIRANRADTENAEPLWLYYQSFPAAGQKPTADAVKGLLYAQTLAPQDRSLRFAAVRQLIADGNFDGAAQLFGALVYDPHLNARRRPLLLAAMQRIQARDAAGARAALDADLRGAPPRA